MHRLANDWPALHQPVTDFLEQFARGPWSSAGF